METMLAVARPTPGRRAAGLVAAGYLLIAFEFFYMASPFAVYFYSVYGPSLRWLNRSPSLAWLGTTFLPHIAAESASPVLDALPAIGAILATVGLAVFAVAAAQVYSAKLLGRGAVTGGLYDRVRHPQYAALMLSGLGLLLLWPRIAALIAFVAMLFAYLMLARIEERECTARFGQAYREYRARTSMFLPGRLPLADRLPHLMVTGPRRAAAWVTVFILSLASALAFAQGVRTWALSQLLTVELDNAVFLAVARIEQPLLGAVVATALADPEVRARIDDAGPRAAFLNYVLPASWTVPEIPMRLDGRGHSRPSDYDRRLYRVVFTRAELRRPATGRSILSHTAFRHPVLEACIDVELKRVVAVEDPEANPMYQGIPVPLF
jgi:protein-S-isoprenylcysteine O-methyltransferase Ste14